MEKGKHLFSLFLFLVEAPGRLRPHAKAADFCLHFSLLSDEKRRLPRPMSSMALTQLKGGTTVALILKE
jgi:hypothetical protein